MHDNNGNSICVSRYDVDAGDVASIGYNTCASNEDPVSTRICNDRGEALMAMNLCYDVDGAAYSITSASDLLGSVFTKNHLRTIIKKSDTYSKQTERWRYEH
jgi:hypothetical protein